MYKFLIIAVASLSALFAQQPITVQGTAPYITATATQGVLTCIFETTASYPSMTITCQQQGGMTYVLRTGPFNHTDSQSGEVVASNGVDRILYNLWPPHFTLPYPYNQPGLYIFLYSGSTFVTTSGEIKL